MSSKRNNIPEFILRYSDQVIAWRREFHRIPEPGFREEKTSAVIMEILESFGLDEIRRVADTGIIALLKGQSEGPCLAIRADIDALPLEEKTNLDFSSLQPGYMHACGHDGHIAMALGAAAILADHRDRIKGCVKFIFQPGEEGFAGAREMIKAGCLQQPSVDMIIGCHLWNFMQPGLIGLRAGPMLASADEFHLTFSGPGGHGAAPHKSPDPILAASEWILASQRIPLKKIDPLQPVVISVGKVRGGSNFNIIADCIELEGTTRAFSPEVQNQLEEELHRSAGKIAELYGLEYKFEYMRNYPPTVNDSRAVMKFRKSAEKIIEKENIQEISPSMVAEDMAYYLQNVPGVFFFLGSSPVPPEKPPVAHHSSRFNIDETVLISGTALFVRFALDYLV